MEAGNGTAGWSWKLPTERKIYEVVAVETGKQILKIKEWKTSSESQLTSDSFPPSLSANINRKFICLLFKPYFVSSSWCDEKFRLVMMRRENIIYSWSMYSFPNCWMETQLVPTYFNLQNDSLPRFRANKIKNSNFQLLYLLPLTQKSQAKRRTCISILKLMHSSEAT